MRILITLHDTETVVPQVKTSFRSVSSSKIQLLTKTCLLLVHFSGSLMYLKIVSRVYSDLLESCVLGTCSTIPELSFKYFFVASRMSSVINVITAKD